MYSIAGVDPGIYKGACWLKRIGSIGGWGASPSKKFSKFRLNITIFWASCNGKLWGNITVTVAVCCVTVQ